MYVSFIKKFEMYLHSFSFSRIMAGMRRVKRFFHLQNLRWLLSKIATYTELFIGVAILIGIALLSTEVFFEIKEMALSIFTTREMPAMQEFLSLAFELVICIEFVKMLVKHTAESAIEVLLYTIARKLIAVHGSMLDALIGVAAIALLFVIRKYLNDPEIYNHELEGDFIVNSGTSLKEVNRRLGSDFDVSKGNTVAGFLYNYLKKIDKVPEPDMETQIGDYIFKIYDMDDELIRHIKITRAKN